jgi:hypothetical protein
MLCIKNEISATTDADIENLLALKKRTKSIKEWFEKIKVFRW